MAHPRERPVERLFAEAAGLLAVKPADVRTPDAIQVGHLRLRRSGWGMACHQSQSAWGSRVCCGSAAGLPRAVGQAADLDEEERATHKRPPSARLPLGLLAVCLRMQLRPGPHAHSAVW